MKFKKNWLMLSFLLLSPTTLLATSLRSSNNNEILHWWEFNDPKYFSLFNDLHNLVSFFNDRSYNRDIKIEDNKNGKNFSPSYFEDKNKINLIQKFLNNRFSNLISKLNNTYSPKSENYFFDKVLNNNFQKLFTLDYFYSSNYFPEDWQNKLKRFFTKFSFINSSNKEYEFVDWDAIEWVKKNNENIEAIIYFDNDNNISKWKAVKLEFKLMNKNEIYVRLVEGKTITKKIISNKNWWKIGQKINLNNKNDKNWFSIITLYFEVGFSYNNKPALYFNSSFQFDQDTIFDDEKGEIKNLIWKVYDNSIFNNSHQNSNVYEIKLNLSGFKKIDKNNEKRVELIKKLNTLYKYEIDLSWDYNKTKYYPWTNGYSYTYKEPNFLKTEYYNELKLIVRKHKNAWYVLKNNLKNNYSWDWISWVKIDANTLFSREDAKKYTQWDIEALSMKYNTETGWIPLEPFSIYDSSKNPFTVLQVTKIGPKWGGYYTTTQVVSPNDIRIFKMKK